MHSRCRPVVCPWYSDGRPRWGDGRIAPSVTPVTFSNNNNHNNKTDTRSYTTVYQAAARNGFMTRRSDCDHAELRWACSTDTLRAPVVDGSAKYASLHIYSTLHFPREIELTKQIVSGHKMCILHRRMRHSPYCRAWGRCRMLTQPGVSESVCAVRNCGKSAHSTIGACWRFRGLRSVECASAQLCITQRPTARG